MKSKKYTYLDWKDVQNSCTSIYADILNDGFEPDVIIGLLWGGVVPTRIMVDLLDFNKKNVHVIYASLYSGVGVTKDSVDLIPHYFSGDIRDKKVLVIDDIWDSGRTMKAALKNLVELNCTVKTATLVFKKIDNPIAPNYYDRIIDGENLWVVFPWERCEFEREIRRKT